MKYELREMTGCIAIYAEGAKTSNGCICRFPLRDNGKSSAQRDMAAKVVTALNTIGDTSGNEGSVTYAWHGVSSLMPTKKRANLDQSLSTGAKGGKTIYNLTTDFLVAMDDAINEKQVEKGDWMAHVQREASGDPTSGYLAFSMATHIRSVLYPDDDMALARKMREMVHVANYAMMIHASLRIKLDGGAS
jgi:hypothetical protein